MVNMVGSDMKLVRNTWIESKGRQKKRPLFPDHQYHNTPESV